MPSWSPDGTTVYFIRTVERDRARGRRRATPAHYLMTVPSVMRVKADGSGQPQRIINGTIRKGSLDVVRLDPPAGAVARRQDPRDGLGRARPDQERRRPPVLRPRDEEVDDPRRLRDRAARPPGPGLASRTARRCCTSGTARDGAQGRAAAIYRWDVPSEEEPPLTGPGYLEPVVLAGRAVHRRDQDRQLRQRRGRSSTRRTAASCCASPTTAASWAPVWSPAGDAIAFLHIEGQIVDLRMAVLGGAPRTGRSPRRIALTEVSGLDGASRPDWFIPASELPVPTPDADPGRRRPSPSASSSAPAQ